VEELWCNGPIEPPEELYRASVQCHGNYIKIVDMAQPPRHSDLQSIIVDVWSSLVVAQRPVHILGHQDIWAKQSRGVRRGGEGNDMVAVVSIEG
jgi:hypothetical protein